MSSEEGKTQKAYMQQSFLNFVETLINHKPPTIHGDGEQSRDFISYIPECNSNEYSSLII